MDYDDFDLAESARVALAGAFGGRFSIAAENLPFDEPPGVTWLKYSYMPVERIYHSIDRECISVVGLVQIGIVFQPDSGVDDARILAKEIANFFKDGKILDVGYIFEGASSKPMQKSDSGWLLPIRFTVRYDQKEV